MIIILKPEVRKDQLDLFVRRFEDMGLKTHVSRGDFVTIVGLIGDTSKVDIESVRTLDVVESVRRVSEPFKAVNRKFHPDDSSVEAGGVRFGPGVFRVIAGPCSVESEEQIEEVARSVKASGAHCLRGGAFKPRTSPYAFQGLKDEGIRLLLHAKRATGLPVVTEIMSINSLPLFADVDVIQVGARNMQNFELLKELSHSGKVILLKRGLANTMEELLMSAEYLIGGNAKIILCERGIRTFENYTRNTLDISAVPMLKSLTHLPVIVDPSHAAGVAALVRPLAKAAAAAGADGVMIEVHNDPPHALCDGAQSLTCEEFRTLMKELAPHAKLEGRTMQ